MRWRIRATPATGGPRPRDLVGEAAAGVLQRPGRSLMTALGTLLAVGVFVAVVGLTATANGQISQRFTELVATQVDVEDVRRAQDPVADAAFPDDADRRTQQITGVRAAGLWWSLPDTVSSSISAAGADPTVVTTLPVVAASPGLLDAARSTMGTGRGFDAFQNTPGIHTVVLGKDAASSLGITSLDRLPAVMIGGIPFQVVGIVDDVARLPQLLTSVIVPHRVAQAVWGKPDPSVPIRMLIDTAPGAAVVVAQQVPVALRPDVPDAFKVTTPPNPTDLRESVRGDLQSLFLLLAGLCLIIGAVGITNTSLVAVLERVHEIGLRRALGARPGHVAAQFLMEAGLLGTFGGILGTSLGVIAVVLTSAAQSWTPLMDGRLVLAAPFIGSFVGMAAGLYPAWRAAKVQPVAALRQ